MAYTQILIDDFNDGVIDADGLEVTQGPGATESSGKLNLSCVVDYPRVEGKNLFDLSAGIFAARLSITGTRAANTEFYIGAHDVSGNHIAALGGPNGTYLTFQSGGLATFNTEVVTDTTVGIGWDWVPGTWWGIGNMSANNVVRMYNSVDGQTWNEMARCTVGGTFAKTATGIVFMAGVWDGSTPNLSANFDDASFWLKTPVASRVAKVRVGNSWTDATPKVRAAGVWSGATPKNRVAQVWRTPQ